MTRVVWLATCFTIVAVALAPAASAKTAPIRWQPAHMARAVVAAKYPVDTTKAVCTGLGKRRKAGYMAFRCVAYRTISDGTRSNTVSTVLWARPLRLGRFCASTISLTRCRPVG